MPLPIQKGIRVVAIGGGTGLSTLLRGLKYYVKSDETPSALTSISDLTAIVTVSDDGGSSGRLRKDFNMLPPGDIRNCIVALSEDDAMMSRLFQYRFDKGSGLEGHSFGNLFLAALNAITEDFGEAVRLSSEILATLGRIYPSTSSDVQLEAKMEDGTIVRGESSITACKGRIQELLLLPSDATPMPETLDAIKRADLITIGPGSLFTSLIPNLLVHGVAEAIIQSKAKKAFVCNLMTQANESLDRSASEHIKALDIHARGKLFDYALLNTRAASQRMRERYADEGAAEVAVDLEQVERLGVQPVLGEFLAPGDDVARHDTSAVASALMRLATRSQQL